MSRPVPVECGVPGNGHWEDERTWVYDLEQVPQAGVSCRFMPRADLATLGGEKVEAATEYGFSIAGRACNGACRLPRRRWTRSRLSSCS